MAWKTKRAARGLSKFSRRWEPLLSMRWGPGNLLSSSTSPLTLTHTPFVHSEKIKKKKKKFFQGWAAMANLVKLNLCHRREDSKGRGYVPYTAGDGAAFMSLD